MATDAERTVASLTNELCVISIVAAAITLSSALAARFAMDDDDASGAVCPASYASVKVPHRGRETLCAALASNGTAPLVVEPDHPNRATPAYAALGALCVLQLVVGLCFAACAAAQHNSGVKLARDLAAKAAKAAEAPPSAPARSAKRAKAEV